MGTGLLGVRLLLVVVFATAGVAKLLDLQGSRAALSGFGIPERVARIGGVALPLIELAVAASLVSPSSARWGAVAGLCLLLAFIAGIANALINDRAPDCHCFGQLHSAPAGGATLARNGVLALLAAFVVWRGPGPSLGSWVADRSTAELVGAVGLVVAAGAAGLGWRAWSRRRAAERAVGGAKWLSEHSGVPLGSLAPRFDLVGACNGDGSLESLRGGGKPVVLTFTDPGCGPCSDLYPHLARWQETLAGEMTIAVLSTGTAAESRPLCTRYGLRNVLLADRRLFDEYRIPGTPSAVLVESDGTVVGGTANGQLMIEELIRRAATSLRAGMSR